MKFLAPVFALLLFCLPIFAATEAAPPADCCQGIDADVANADAKPQYAKGFKPSPNAKGLGAAFKVRHSAMLEKLPKATAASYDCRALGIVPPIRAQKDCGSCWLKSGKGIIESAFIRAGKMKNDGTTSLSSQFFLDCARSGGCEGDDYTTVMTFAKAKGLPMTEDYGPYMARTQTCKYAASMPLHKIDDWGFCYPENDEAVSPVQRIKDCMARYGPIGSAIAADRAFMNVRRGQIFRGSGATDIDHEVILCGWDDSKNAWLLRNSWGDGWADDGYCWIDYRANLIGYHAIWCDAGSPSPTPPSPTPPAPMPPAPNGSIVLTLTAEQVKSVNSQSGHVKLRPETTVGEILQLLTPPAPPAPTTAEPPAIVQPSAPVLPSAAFDSMFQPQQMGNASQCGPNGCTVPQPAFRRGFFGRLIR
jgi:hypothetical protein